MAASVQTMADTGQEARERGASRVRHDLADTVGEPDGEGPVEGPSVSFPSVRHLAKEGPGVAETGGDSAPQCPPSDPEVGGDCGGENSVPDLVEVLLEMFDGEEVEPNTEVVAIRSISRRECYCCGERRRWWIPGGDWTCPRCHPPLPSNVVWNEPAEASRG